MPLTVFAAHLRRDDRALCPGCYGTGVRVGAEIVATCERAGVHAGERASSDAHCHVGTLYCERHRCASCLGDGVTCPHCLGMRWVRVPNLFNTGNTSERCPTCTEGNNVNPTKEMRAIKLWLRRHCADCATIRGRDEQTRPDGSWLPCPTCGSVRTLLDVMEHERNERERAAEMDLWPPERTNQGNQGEERR